MNTNTPEIQLYMFQDGSRHGAVKVLSSFLNSHSSVSVSNLKKDDSFDKNTESALKSFQKHKNLIPTGRMDLKTWLAIGAEMDPISINVVSINDQTLRDLLQMGYRSRFPFKKFSARSQNGFSGNVTKTTTNFDTKSATGDFSFTVYVAAFAPFNRFGPLNLSRGDGNARRFGFDPLKTYRLRAESKMVASPGSHSYPWSVTKAAEATDSYLIVPSSIPVFTGISILTLKERKEKSEGTVSDEDTGEQKPEGLVREGNSIRYHFWGNDDAFALWGNDSFFASDIDIHADINFEYDYYTKPNSFIMRIFGKILGDQFPAVETYVLDQIGNGVMLGVFQVREGDGPVLTRDGGRGIIGDKKLPMIEIDVSIIIENGFFTGIKKFSRIISLAEHNKQFTDLLPVKPEGFNQRFSPVLPIFPRPILFP